MFEIANPFPADSAEGGNGEHDRVSEPSTEDMIPRKAQDRPHKIFLPRRSGDSRFGPRQYYYPASRTGVVPSWAVPAAVRPS
jgi:hypothetical protein